jgi:hypothetical protein
MGSILADSRDWIWIVYDREKKLAIFNPDRSSGTIKSDFSRWRDLNLALKEEEGPFTYIYTLTETKDGSIWMGTDKGIKIYYSPQRLFDEPNPPQSIPVVVIRNSDTLVELVLGSEAVRSIKVDGGNRKWVGTENAGVFLLSPDGKTELFHFTKDNSPLPSNSVYSIAIDGETGDVYFGTDKGLVSFRYTATDGKENYENLKIFPNPVRENFNGYISISGLKDNSEVKSPMPSGNWSIELFPTAEQPYGMVAVSMGRKRVQACISSLSTKNPMTTNPEKIKKQGRYCLLSKKKFTFLISKKKLYLCKL